MWLARAAAFLPSSSPPLHPPGALLHSALLPLTLPNSVSRLAELLAERGFVCLSLLYLCWNKISLSSTWVLLVALDAFKEKSSQETSRAKCGILTRFSSSHHRDDSKRGSVEEGWAGASEMCLQLAHWGRCAASHGSSPAMSELSTCLLVPVPPVALWIHHCGLALRGLLGYPCKGQGLQKQKLSQSGPATL